MAFVDETTITVSSGHGGQGAATFRREKYAPKGGPDGGDGGKGGDVVFLVRKNLKTLSHLSGRQFFKAEDGHPGQKKKRHGKDGDDACIEVPPGTLVRNADDGRVLKDLAGEESWTFLRGGKGGKGNVHFASSVRQTPRYAQPGLPGEEVTVLLELNLVADLGFVGKPNAGKSTLLSVLTNANPKIGSYPFTTKVPNLGVMQSRYNEIVLADIPGLLEGASQGVGLGIRFLKHVSRTASLVFLVDLAEETYLDDFPLLLGELEAFGNHLADKKRILVATKTDLLETPEETAKRIAELKQKLPKEEILSVSSYSRVGLDELRERMSALVLESHNGR